MRIIGGEWKGRRLEPVRSRGVRPTADRVREAWMSILQARLPGASVLDLFAGSGAVGLEALSRGAAHVVFVERNQRAARALKRNVQRLRASGSCTVVVADALTYAQGLSPLACDLALADPPYGRGLAGRLLSAYLRLPFARELWVEHRRGESLPRATEAVQKRYGDTVLTGVTAPTGVAVPSALMPDAAASADVPDAIAVQAPAPGTTAPSARRASAAVADAIAVQALAGGPA